ncbi:MAG: Ser-Thr-rich GPI-anchored membrane family protein [Bacteroidota bacterium]
MNIKRKLPLPFLGICLLLGGRTAKGQDVDIKSVVLKGGDVIVNYDLLDTDLDHRYTLNLFSSLDEFVQPLELVEGDIGIDQEVGGNKQVVWHAREELGADFKGSFSLDLKGRLYIPFVVLNNFDSYEKLKRGRPYNLTWAAGRGSSVLTFDLFNKKDELVHTFTNVANVGEYELVIPKSVKPGRGYYMEISDQSNKDDLIRTEPFNINRKVPLLLTGALIGAALTSGYVILTNLPSDSSDPSPDPGSTFLPDPVLPGTN